MNETRRDPWTNALQVWEGDRWIDKAQTFTDYNLPGTDSTSPAAFVTGAALNTALTSDQNPSMDSISARDRADGFNRRLIVPMVLTVILALFATLAWSYALTQFGTPQLMPAYLDRLLVFLAVIGGMGFFVWTKANSQEYKHSQAGIRHTQIETAERIHERQIEHERKMKRDALMAVLQIEDKTNGSE